MKRQTLAFYIVLAVVMGSGVCRAQDLQFWEAIALNEQLDLLEKRATIEGGDQYENRDKFMRATARAAAKKGNWCGLDAFSPEVIAASSTGTPLGVTVIHRDGSPPKAYVLKPDGFQKTLSTILTRATGSSTTVQTDRCVYRDQRLLTYIHEAHRIERWSHSDVNGFDKVWIENILELDTKYRVPPQENAARRSQMQVLLTLRCRVFEASALAGN